MARVRIRYYVVERGRGYWKPNKRMRDAGFAPTCCGPDGPDAWAKAQRLTLSWDRHRGALPPETPPLVPGSLADVLDRYRRMTGWERKAPRTRQEWEDVWRILAPVWGDIPAAEIQAEDVDAFYRRCLDLYSLHKCHRIIKVFRALCEVAVGMRLITSNPTAAIRNAAPRGRSAIWSAGEVELLAACAWARGYHGLAVAIRIAYDSILSPVDVRRLTRAQRRDDGHGTYFDTARAKTGKRAFATLSPATEALLDRYLAGLGVELLETAPIIRHRSGQPYTKDKLAHDFRVIRDSLWIGETRQMLDLRRTGNVEAAVGGAAPSALAAKAGNTIAQSNALYEIYTPVQLAAVRDADGARERGRRKLKGEGE